MSLAAAGIALVTVLVVLYVERESRRLRTFDPDDPFRYGAQVYVAPGFGRAEPSSVNPNDIPDDD